MSQVNFKEVNTSEVSHLLDGRLILIVTATDIETEYTHSSLKPILGYDGLIKFFHEDLTYYIGALGNYVVAHVQSSMGSIGRSGSIHTVSSALNFLKAKVVIMVGIAFGVDESKQKIGDVIVSESVIPYNSKRVGEKETIQRGIEAPASKVLVSRLNSAKKTWKFEIEGRNADIIPTRLLSGEELVDNLQRRQELTAANPDSKGEEMEGAGVYTACDGIAEWIIIKGICDFADGQKGVNKQQNQTIAIRSALSLCSEIFNSSTAFKHYNISPNNKVSSEMIFDETKIGGILFEIYDASKEPYYIRRDVDNTLNINLGQYGIWVYGVTGCGKSNLIIRNLLHSKKEFVQVCLATCIGDNSSFFKEILSEIAIKTGIDPYERMPDDFSLCVKKIIELLKTHYYDKELVIFIEEIPISSDEDYKEFADKMFSFILQKNLEHGLEKVKFVLSSINNPTKYIKQFQQKVHQHMKFIALDYWNETEIGSLISMIESNLQFTLTPDIRGKLIGTSKGSPRFVKKFFRDICTIGSAESAVMEHTISETSRELNLCSHD